MKQYNQMHNWNESADKCNNTNLYAELFRGKEYTQHTIPKYDCF